MQRSIDVRIGLSNTFIFVMNILFQDKKCIFDLVNELQMIQIKFKISNMPMYENVYLI